MSLSDADRRILRIRALMQSGDWERDRLLLYRRLAREWQCSREAVEQYATQAARFLRLEQATETTEGNNEP